MLLSTVVFQKGTALNQLQYAPKLGFVICCSGMLRSSPQPASLFGPIALVRFLGLYQATFRLPGRLQTCAQEILGSGPPCRTSASIAVLCPVQLRLSGSNLQSAASEAHAHKALQRFVQLWTLVLALSRGLSCAVACLRLDSQVARNTKRRQAGASRRSSRHRSRRIRG